MSSLKRPWPFDGDQYSSSCTENNSIPWNPSQLLEPNVSDSSTAFSYPYDAPELDFLDQSLDNSHVIYSTQPHLVPFPPEVSHEASDSETEEICFGSVRAKFFLVGS